MNQQLNLVLAVKLLKVMTHKFPFSNLTGIPHLELWQDLGPCNRHLGKKGRSELFSPEILTPSLPLRSDGLRKEVSPPGVAR